jgi:hypothetical protein
VFLLLPGVVDLSGKAKPRRLSGLGFKEIFIYNRTLTYGKP